MYRLRLRIFLGRLILRLLTSPQDASFVSSIAPEVLDLKLFYFLAIHFSCANMILCELSLLFLVVSF
jgi:hypothetical protein